MTTLVKGHLRGLDVLEALNAMKFATAAEVAKELEMTRPTAHRYLKTLCEAGYATQIGGGPYFCPSRRVKGLGAGYDPVVEAIEIAEPHVNALSKSINWTCYLHAVEDDVIVTRHVAKSPREYVSTPLGGRLPVAFFSAGRAHLAAMPDDVCEDIIARSARLRFKPQTQVEAKDALRGIVRLSRQRGYGFRENGLVPKTCSFAVPIKTNGSEQIYLTTHVMLSAASLPRAVDENMPHVQDTVAAIEREVLAQAA